MQRGQTALVMIEVYVKNFSLLRRIFWSLKRRQHVFVVVNSKLYGLVLFHFDGQIHWGHSLLVSLIQFKNHRTRDIFAASLALLK